MPEAGAEFHFSPRPNRASEINWHPWSQGAFDEARQTGRPILLSISAVWCHWCHVMDETTYSHPGVIDIINTNYVPVRVDNDVRPDINQRYNMGGWPTTAFLTSSGDILTGGTYMPPDQMASALMKVADYYRSNQADIASRVLEARKRAASGVARSAGDLEEVLRDPKSGLYAGSQDADEHYYTMDAEERKQSQAPYVDRRIYTSWNAALAIAYLDAGKQELAAKLLDSLFKRAYRPGEGMTHAEGADGQLGDQVWSLFAAVRAYQHGLGDRWIEIALELSAHIEERYGDSVLGRYFDRAGGDELGRLGERIKPLAENSIAAMALIELDTLLGDPSSPHRERARRALESVAALPRQYGLMAAVFARGLDRLSHAIKVTTKNPELARAARAAQPYAVIDPSGAPGARRAHTEQDGAVVCAGTICLGPVFTPTDVAEAIREASTTRA